MANDKRISELPGFSDVVTPDDVFAFVDESGDVTYKLTFAQLLTFVSQNGSFGAVFSFGTANPTTTGNNGDIFLNTSSNQILQKIGGSWSVIYTIEQGVIGNTVSFASAVPGGVVTGNNGDVYFCTSNSTWYKNTSTASGKTWTLQTTLSSGPAGPRGNSILNGSVNPTSGDGINGDFFLNTSSNVLFGPKASGAWPGTGIQLTPNVPNTIITGTTAPANTLGNNGDYYINKTTFTWYGPKASNVWPSGVPLGGGGTGTAITPDDVPIAAGSSLTTTINYASLYNSHGNTPQIEVLMTDPADTSGLTSYQIYDVVVRRIFVGSTLTTLTVTGHDSGDGATTIDNLIIRIR